MRIWHEKLISKLCRQHLLAVWREGLGCWSILIQNKKGYRNHPAVKEFETSLPDLYQRLSCIRKEMIKRGYNPKEMPDDPDPECLTTCFAVFRLGDSKPWQTLEEQIEVLRAKGCDCKV